MPPLRPVAPLLLAAIAASPGATARAQSRVAFDTSRQRSVFYATSISSWEGGTAWRLLSMSGIGGPHPMVYDPIRDHVLANTGGLLAIWDGAHWEWSPPVPTDMWSHFQAWDVARDRLVSIGSTGTWSTGTWEWDGATATGPLPTPAAVLVPNRIAFDPATQQVLAVTGNRNGTQAT